MQESSRLFSSITNALSQEKRASNSFILSVGTAAVLAALLIFTMVANQSIPDAAVAIVTLVVGTALFGLSAWLSRRNHPNRATAINIVMLSILIVSRVFLQKGLALQISAIYFVLVSAIAVYTLPRKWIGRVVIFAFLVSILTILIDQYTVDVPVSPLGGVTAWLAVLVGGVYLLALATQFNYLSLRTKLIIGFLSLSIGPLILLGWRTYSTTNAIVENQIKAEILRSSVSTRAEINAFLDSEFSTIGDEARAPEIVEFMGLPPSQMNSPARQNIIYEELNALDKSKPSYIRSYALLDKNGVDVVDTDRSRLGSDFSQSDFFKFVQANTGQYASGLTSLPKDDHILYFATPVTSGTGKLIGVYFVTYNAEVIQTTLEGLIAANKLPSPTTAEYTYIIDGTNYFILAHSTRVDLLYKTYLDKSDPRLAKLQAQADLSPEKLNSLIMPLPETVAALGKMEDTASFSSPTYGGEPTESAAARLGKSNWIVVTSQPASTIAGILQSQTRSNVVASVLISMLAAVIALIASNLFTSPILQLTHVAENISTGNFSQKADIRLNDEIGVLAKTFNGMSDQIQGLIANLEKRVEQRTADLEQRSQDLIQATVQTEKRARQLETIAQISRSFSIEKDQEKLLPLITQTVSEAFGFYHVGIFLLDKNKKFALLRAANSAGGQVMLKRQHKLEVGQTGIVGNVTYSGKPRVALDTDEDSVFFKNPDLPETRSEMAVPLTARGEIIGALDVQSKVSNAFADEDVSIISILADQVAVAIDNVNLIQEAQRSLAESQSLFTEYLATAWQKKSNTAVMGYRQSATGGGVIAPDSAEERTALQEHNGGSISIPIQVRDQVIGILNVRSIGDGKSLSKDEVNIVEAVAERLGLALDNARLFEETSTRASRERLVSDITTKIRGTNDPQEMVKTAIDELRRALGATHIEIVPQKISPPPDK